VKFKAASLSLTVLTLLSLGVFGVAHAQTPAPPQAPAAVAPSAPQAATPTATPPPSHVETLIGLPNRNAHAILKTSMGPIEIRLREDIAPRTVRNFIQLATGVREFIDVKSGKKLKRPFYNGLIFHRVVRGFLIQTGCPYGSGRGGPGYSLPDEFNTAARHNKPGIVSMAPQRSESGLTKDSSGSQFFITLRAAPELDDHATIFGEVVKGMDIVRKIAAAPVGPTERPIKRIYIRSVEIIEPPAHD
jgi:peptidyl-prolyl cis-trans isomerase A (cyclophilin A)